MCNCSRKCSDCSRNVVIFDRKRTEYNRIQQEYLSSESQLNKGLQRESVDW